VVELERHAVFLYDDYPEGYPEAVASPRVDAEMQAGLTPDDVYFGDMGTARGKSLTLCMSYAPLRARTLPVASEIDLLLGETLIGTAVWTARSTRALSNTNSSYCLALYLHDETPAGAQQRFLLDANAGGIERVRLVFRPSRSAALEEPDFDRYWAGTLDVTVPVTTPQRVSRNRIQANHDMESICQRCAGTLPPGS